MVQAGLPVLAYAPVRYLQALWTHGLVKPRRTGGAFSESIVMVDDTVDFTGCNAGVIELVRDEVLAMERRMRQVVEQETKADDRLSADVRINHRQRALIG